MRPALLTFDVFGTLVDWRRGLRESLRPLGHVLPDDRFDAIVDRQGRDEQAAPFRTYREIVARSLVAELGLDAADADRIGAEVGRWPLYPEVPDALRRLAAVARLAATTNSDRAHGAELLKAVPAPLRWICAEELRLYKPDPRFWAKAAALLGATPGAAWWHVSAYADYDLGPARALGLTTVFVARPHARPGPADHTVPDLAALAARVAATGAP